MKTKSMKPLSKDLLDKMDSEIATRVMKWKSVWVRGYSTGAFIGGHYTSERACKSACERDQRPIHLWETSPGMTCGKSKENWSPTRDILAAWDVVNEMRRRCSVQVDTVGFEPNVFRCAMGWGDDILNGNAEAPTAPLAICKAALNALPKKKKS